MEAFGYFSRCLTYIGRCGTSVRLISSKYRPNPSPGEPKQAKKSSRKILDSRRGVRPPYLWLLPSLGMAMKNIIIMMGHCHSSVGLNATKAWKCGGLPLFVWSQSCPAVVYHLIFAIPTYHWGPRELKQAVANLMLFRTIQVTIKTHLQIPFEHPQYPLQYYRVSSCAIFFLGFVPVAVPVC